MSYMQLKRSPDKEIREGGGEFQPPVELQQKLSTTTAPTPVVHVDTKSQSMSTDTQNEIDKPYDYDSDPRPPLSDKWKRKVFECVSGAAVIFAVTYAVFPTKAENLLMGAILLGYLEGNSVKSKESGMNYIVTIGSALGTYGICSGLARLLFQ